MHVTCFLGDTDKYFGVFELTWSTFKLYFINIITKSKWFIRANINFCINTFIDYFISSLATLIFCTITWSSFIVFVSFTILLSNISERSTSGVASLFTTSQLVSNSWPLSELRRPLLLDDFSTISLILSLNNIFFFLVIYFPCWYLFF